MSIIRVITVGFAAILAGISLAAANPKIDDTTLASSGNWAGMAPGAHGVHVAVLENKGSRFVVQFDGADGPRIDRLIGLDGNPYNAATAPPNSGLRPIPVVFSSDGGHCAYMAKVADQYIVVLDTKQIAGGKFTGIELFNANLTISAGGQHVLFCLPTRNGQYQVIVDGTPGPVSHAMPKFVTSPDGAHYAYVGTQADGHDTKWGYVDGKQVNYFGDDLQYTAKNHLVAVVCAGNDASLSFDTQPALRAAGIDAVWFSPTGGQFAAMIHPQAGSPSVLSINGKTIAGTERVQATNVFFSADDKRWAALCSAGASKFIILDGKKENEYQMISTNPAPTNPVTAPLAWGNGRPPAVEVAIENAKPDCPGFTADSSKFVYVALSGGKSYLVTNEDESDGLPNTFSPVIPDDGRHIAYIASPATSNRPASFVLDGKRVNPQGHGASSPTEMAFLFSPDGNHTLLVSGGVVFRDGVEQTGFTCAGQFTFSPDSQHVLSAGFANPNPTGPSLFLDGKPVCTGIGATNVLRPIFSPDSKHVFWVGHRAPETSTDFDNGVLYVDGRPTSIHFVDSDLITPGAVEVSADDTLNFVVRTAGELHRYRVTPGDDTSLATMLAATPAKRAK